jgi:hypothetical protein
MLKNAIVIIPFDLPWEHTTDYTYQTAKILSRDNTVVCYMQKEARSVKELIQSHSRKIFWNNYSENIFTYYPVYLIPFRRFDLIEKINIRLNILIFKLLIGLKFRNRKFRRSILWIFYPEYHYLIDYLGNKYESIYDCVDYHIGSSLDEDRRKSVTEWEAKLIRKCKYLFVNSHVLFEIHKNIRPDLKLVPQGFRLESFKNNHAVTGMFDKIPKPVVGYVGGINFRLDYKLLISTAKNSPVYSFVFVGPVQENDKQFFNAYVRGNIDKLFALPNVFWFDSVGKDFIPAVIRSFDIAMIPYNLEFEFNKYCYPMKLFEYLYLGKPVIATPITELNRYPELVKTGNSAAEWKKILAGITGNPSGKSTAVRMRKLATQNSWENKINSILKYLN